jgi:L-threonylcarbamoyladenylate synthase
VREPDHPLARTLLLRAGPLAVTSANLSGAASPTTAEQVLSQLGGRIALILDGGKTPGGVPSTVVDCVGPEARILREGALSKEEILTFLSGNL